MGKIKDRYWKEIENEDDSGYDLALMEEGMLESDRLTAQQIIENHFSELLEEQAISCSGPIEELVDVAMHNTSFHETIWEASTVLLPKLEIQVVIDGKNNCFVSTGTAGYVDFFTPPVGMSLPIRCWIHTHPFGAAYFSGTDIRTVSIWQSNMECAYVLGGIGHFGFWSKHEPQQLEIYRNFESEQIQTWNRKEEEE